VQDRLSSRGLISHVRAASVALCLAECVFLQPLSLQHGTVRTAALHAMASLLLLPMAAPWLWFFAVALPSTGLMRSITWVQLQ
jgi:hypothetical protein